MPKRLRLIVGAMVVGVLTALWFGWLERAPISDVQPVMVMAGIATVGLIGGLTMRSWWAVVIAPAAVLGMSYLGSAIACADGCPPASEDTPLTVLILQLIFSGGPATVGAAVGTLIARAVIPAAQRWLRQTM
ncbi:MAG: hypothetical protein M3Q65_17930 [Chloroflexota bacterium]|nr:hypothetical protein [Chloroflexota bacterium]